jgi:hypothetical protein
MSMRSEDELSHNDDSPLCCKRVHDVSDGCLRVSTGRVREKSAALTTNNSLSAAQWMQSVDWGAECAHRPGQCMAALKAGATGQPLSGSSPAELPLLLELQSGSGQHACSEGAQKERTLREQG